MTKLKKIAAIVTMVLPGMYAHAQNAASNTENTDVMKSNGKIYVVMAVVVTILIGLFLYLWSVDRKIGRLERKD